MGIVGRELCLLSAAVVCLAKQGSPLCFSGTLDTLKEKRDGQSISSTFITVTLAHQHQSDWVSQPTALAATKHPWESDPIGC